MMQVKEREDSVPQATAAEADPGPDLSLRRCIVTRDSLPKDRLIRFVLGPEGEVVPDLAGKLPGRGVWVKAERPVLEEAIKKNAFAKAFKAPAKVPADFAQRVVVLLERRIVDLLGLARRSGAVDTGFEKVEAALQRGRVTLLIEASDAAAEGRAKLARQAPPGVEIWAPLAAEALGRAIGKDHAVHVAIGPGGLADRLKTALRRYSGLNRRGSSARVGDPAGRPPRGSQTGSATGPRSETTETE